jgi:hypothetical protein
MDGGVLELPQGCSSLLATLTTVLVTIQPPALHYSNRTFLRPSRPSGVDSSTSRGTAKSILVLVSRAPPGEKISECVYNDLGKDPGWFFLRSTFLDVSDELGFRTRDL